MNLFLRQLILHLLLLTFQVLKIMYFVVKTGLSFDIFYIGFLSFLKSRTGPDRTETGRFDSVAVQFRFDFGFFSKKKRTGLVVFFSSKLNQTKNTHPYLLVIMLGLRGL